MTAHVKGCTGQSAFLTWRDAERRAQIMRRRSEEPLVPYRCRHCGMYHIGATE